MKVNSKRIIRVLSKEGKHSGGTKWYRVTLVTLLSPTDSEHFVINSWGANGKAGFAKVETPAGVNEYEDSISKKSKARNGGRYVFGKQSEVYLNVGDEEGTSKKAMNEFGLTTMRETQAIMTKMEVYLRPLAHEIGPLEPKVVLVDHKLIAEKIEKQDYGNDWGMFG